MLAFNYSKFQKQGKMSKKIKDCYIAYDGGSAYMVVSLKNFIEYFYFLK